MIKYPLFGQDSVPQFTSKVLGLIGTFIFWVVFFILMIFIKPVDKKPKYKEVQIVLSSTPKNVPKPEPMAAPEPAKSAAPVTEQDVSPVVQETSQPAASVPKTEPVVETPKPVQKVETPKPAPEKAAPKPKSEPKPAAKQPAKVENKPAAKPEPVKQPEPTFTGEYVDPMDAFNAQTSKVSDKKFNWDNFENSATTTESVNTKSAPVQPNPVESSFSGSAGETTKQENQKVTSSAKAANNKQDTKENTNASLDIIANTQSVENAAVYENMSKNDETVNSVSNNSLRWTNGASRKILMPKTPKLNISKENQSKVNATEVNITFTVNSEGYVDRSSVKANPPISDSVLEEIRNQIAEWWFDSGDSNASATFVWKIQRN